MHTQFLVGKPTSYKRPLGRPRNRLENNIKIDLRDVGYAGVDCIQLGQERVQ
jgi:hypothetical protein